MVFNSKIKNYNYIIYKSLNSFCVVNKKQISLPGYNSNTKNCLEAYS